jgi:hypothetical protein
MLKFEVLGGQEDHYHTLYKNGFIPAYDVWTFHGESDIRVVAEDEHDCDVGDVDRMNEIPTQPS